MSQDIEQLKKEVSQFSGIDDKERKEILSDLRYLEESNKKYAQMKLDDIEHKYRQEKDFALFCLILGVSVILYVAFKFW
jgi:hypothetical protein